MQERESKKPMKIDDQIKKLNQGFDMLMDFIRDNREALDSFAEDLNVMCGAFDPCVYMTCKKDCRDLGRAFVKNMAVEKGWDWSREDKGWQVEYKCKTPRGFRICIERIEEPQKNTTSPLVFA